MPRPDTAARREIRASHLKLGVRNRTEAAAYYLKQRSRRGDPPR